MWPRGCPQPLLSCLALLARSELQASGDEEAKIDFPSDLTSSAGALRGAERVEDRKYIHKIAESFRLHTLPLGRRDLRWRSKVASPIEHG